MSETKILKGNVIYEDGFFHGGKRHKDLLQKL